MYLTFLHLLSIFFVNFQKKQLLTRIFYNHNLIVLRHQKKKKKPQLHIEALYDPDLYLCDPHSLIRRVGTDGLQQALCCYEAQQK